MAERDTFRVGEVFNANMAPWEGAQYSYQDDMHIILFSFPGIYPGERRAIESGQWYFRLYIEGDAIVFLFKADAPNGRPGIPWHDMPYSWHKVEREARTLPVHPDEIPEPLGVLIFVFLLDAPTGRIVALNAKNASHTFTRQLHEAIYQQSRLPYDHDAFHARIEDIRRRYPTPEALAEAAQVRCLGGIYEGG